MTHLRTGSDRTAPEPRSPMANAESAVLTFGDESHEIPRNGRLLFGRDPSCHLVISGDDRRVSRFAGSVDHIDGRWWVVNRSENRTLHLELGAGLTCTLPVKAPANPTSRHCVTGDGIIVVVVGTERNYYLHLRLPDTTTSRLTSFTPSNPLDTVSKSIEITAAERQALAALAYDYLRSDRGPSPRPLVYREAADLLNCSENSVRKRVERVRTKLITRGIVDLAGETHAPRLLCEWALAARLIGFDDLRCLPERRTGWSLDQASRRKKRARRERL